MSTVTLTINGKQVQAQEGETLLTIIRHLNIDIPHTCHHDSVEPYGACRLCTVEITKESWDGWSRHVTSCLYPVEEGLIVATDSPSVIELRKHLLDLMLARSPKAQLVQEMAAAYGITKTSFEEIPEGDDCILCGLCVRVCDTMGFHAISAVNRGHGREIAPPLNEAPPDCVGCLACAQICPTDYIKFTDNGNTREIWGRSFELLTCAETGEPTITREFAEFLNRHRDIPMSYFEKGDQAHRKETALTMGRISQWGREEEPSC